ncbi:carbohydrate ABC transporter permease [Arthrobacter sp. FX8]|uniref:carbohydrate ABC transporter permease n=1 Tax=Arthrobacter sp. FX8 TaxID=2997335 RepID=UPI00227B83A4|nr:carbohydrate ABC transporter permease [Arthrobacter sp. FX8]WAJ35433.1 carbohydrate ABC transporter permease [Arthrobacter sp. FX8]
MERTRRSSSVKRTRRWQTALHYLILTVVALFFFLPVYYLIVGSFRPSSEVLSGLSGFVPTNLSFANYAGVFDHLSSDATGHFVQFALVSIVVTTAVVAGSLIVNSMAAYSFARMKWRGKKVLFLLVIILTIIPFEAVALPLYYMFSGQRDTVIIQAIPFIANAFSIFSSTRSSWTSQARSKRPRGWTEPGLSGRSSKSSSRSPSRHSPQWPS